VIHDPARGAHHHLGAALEGAQLGTIVLAAVDGQHMEALHVGGVALEGLGHLDGQLAGGRQHQHLGGAALQVDARQHGQGEGRRLAGAGLGLAHQVAPFQQQGDGAGLDGGRGFVADITQRLLERFAKGESQRRPGPERFQRTWEIPVRKRAARGPWRAWRTRGNDRGSIGLWGPVCIFRTGLPGGPVLARPEDLPKTAETVWKPLQGDSR
jgi:hypothetical protein